jgi:hypothetical protein
VNKITTECDACHAEVSRLRGEGGESDIVFASTVNLVGCFNAIRDSRIAARTHSRENRTGAVAVSSQLLGRPAAKAASLVHDLDLLVEHLAGETVDCHTPVAPKPGKGGSTQ